MTVPPASLTVDPGDDGHPVSPGTFAGWRILAITVATAILTGPGQTIGVSVFIDPMVESLGVSRSAVSTAYLVGTLAGASAMPFFGRFVDRRGVRLAQTLVGLGFTLALINMASVQNIVWLAIGFGGIRMMGQGALSMITTVTVSLWFERRRGVAMGILATVAGAGIVAVPLALNAVISATSWRVAWLIAAATILATVVPLGWFGLISRPADVGQLPDGLQYTSDESPRADGTVAPVWTRQRSFTRGEAIRTRQFWILAAVTTMTGMLITGLNFHQIDLLSEAGLSSGEAAAMFLPQIIGSSVTGISVGYLIDRVGVRFVPALVMLLLIGVHLLGAAMQPGVVVFIYAVSLGATGGAGRACLSTMLPGYFGTDHIGSIQGVMTVTGVAGSAIGPVTLSLVQGWLGSYQAANLALLVLPAITLLATLTNRPPLVHVESLDPVA
ncbi:MAG: MFS transporter [Acidimicrobiales bacterium]